MSIQHQILADLTAGQSDPQLIAERLGSSPSKITQICKNMARDSLLEAIPLAMFTPYRITAAGREFLNAKSTPTPTPN